MSAIRRTPHRRARGERGSRSSLEALSTDSLRQSPGSNPRVHTFMDSNLPRAVGTLRSETQQSSIQIHYTNGEASRWGVEPRLACAGIKVDDVTVVGVANHGNFPADIHDG